MQYYINFLKNENTIIIKYPLVLFVSPQCTESVRDYKVPASVPYFIKFSITVKLLKKSWYDDNKLEENRYA